MNTISIFIFIGMIINCNKNVLKMSKTNKKALDETGANTKTDTIKQRQT